jgi:hypothetical protein
VVSVTEPAYWKSGPLPDTDPNPPKTKPASASNASAGEGKVVQTSAEKKAE